MDTLVPNIKVNRKEQYCPNTLWSNNRFSLGFLKTMADIDRFPLKEYWELHKMFKQYNADGVKVFVLCDWCKSVLDSRKFILLLINKGEIKLYDLNNIEINDKRN